MAKGKDKSGKLSVFKGREAKLNRAIFHTLALKGPQTIWDLTKEVKQQKFFRRKLYPVINRRVRILQQLGYVEEVGTRKTLNRSTGVLYHITPKAYLAILLNQTDLEWLIQKAWETDVLDLSAILAKYLKD